MITTIKTPGKLMLAGDWSVLELGNHSIVMPLNKYVTVTVQQDNAFKIHAPDIDLNTLDISWHAPQLTILTQLSHEQQKKFLTTQKALEVVLSYIHEQNQEHTEKTNTHEINPFSLTINSEISTIKLPDGTITKPGLGSSAAVTVGIITALLDFHNFDITSVIAKNIIFKLSYLAHIQSQSVMGSGFDIAVCTYEKVIMYQRFDPVWLVKKIQTTPSLTELVNTKWPQLTIAPMILPEDMRVLTGFVGKSAQTTNLLSLVQNFKKNNPEKYRELMSALDSIVKNLIEKLTQNNTKNHNDIIELIKQHRNLLKTLSQYCDNNLETPELTKLITIAEQYDAGAKFSGAGGGDCGIALCFDQQTEENIKASWLENNIIPLEIQQHLS
jgi:phosphomevalonate kinase